MAFVEREKRDRAVDVKVAKKRFIISNLPPSFYLGVMSFHSVCHHSTFSAPR